MVRDGLEKNGETERFSHLTEIHQAGWNTFQIAEIGIRSHKKLATVLDCENYVDGIQGFRALRCSL